MADARGLLQNRDQLVGILPASGDARQASFGTGRTEPLKGLEVVSWNQRGHGLAVTSDDDGLTLFSGSDLLGQCGLRLGYG